MEKVYDVFISYRRDKGQDIARALQLGLENQGLRVFFDLEELRGGQFNTKLYSAIERSKNVIFLLTEGACDRFANENDWCRMELEYALQKQINLVPVVPLGSPRSFPELLPESLETLRTMNIAVLDKNDLFKQTVREIVTNYLCDIDLPDSSESAEAEKIFAGLVRSYKTNDGIIDVNERTDLELKAREFKLSAVRREAIIQQVEQEFQQAGGFSFSPAGDTPPGEMQYDVFISYRRDGGAAYARLMYDRLTQAGYTVSFDMDTLKNGNFNEELLRRVISCKNFVILLSKECFQRTLEGCKREDDWMRIELATALFNKKNIVTVMLPGFVFPEKLPADIDAVRFKNGPKYDDYYLDNFYNKLINDFLLGKEADSLSREETAEQKLFEDTLKETDLQLDQLCEEILGNDADDCRTEAEVFYRQIPRLIPYAVLKKIDETWEEAEHQLHCGDHSTAARHYLEVIELASKIKPAAISFTALLLGDGIDTTHPQWFEKALDKARQGDAEYQYNIGMLYSQGIGVKQDPAAAFRWFEAAAALEHIKAISAAGAALASGNGVETDYAQAFSYLRKAEAHKEPSAYEHLGYLYQQGYGLEAKDYKTAIRYYRQAAELGNTDAMVALGQMIEEGQGGTAAPEQALNWYRMAASQNNAAGQMKAAQCLFFGKGSEVDHNEALSLARTAADQGNADAMALLGKAYDDGLGVPVDKTKAENLYSLAAANGSLLGKRYLAELEAEVQYKKGMECLQKQLGEERDYSQARIWFEKAALQGNASAMEQLAFLCERGLGGKFDIQEARAWYEKSAAKGNVVALAGLAGIYFRGDAGIEKDYARALELSKKAASQWSSVPREEQWKVSSVCYYIGKMYEKGTGVEKNPLLALRFYLSGARKGNLRCAFLLGKLYSSGLEPIPPSEENSHRWYAFCAASESQIPPEDDTAAHIIGHLYSRGLGGVKKDHKVACMWYEKSAKLGNMFVLNDIAQAYRDGTIVQSDIEKAVQYYTAAAERGYATAQNALAEIYYTGKGCLNKNYQLAFKWAMQAAENQDAAAMFLLFKLYRDGKGVAPNETEKIKWLKRAAQNKNGTALAFLGKCHEEGSFGFEKDLLKAVELYHEAAARESQQGFYELGRCFWYGIGMEKNTAQALKYLELSRLKIDASIQLLAQIYCGDNNFARRAELFNDFARKTELFNELAPADNKKILFALAVNFQYGRRGLEKNAEKYFECLSAAARYGDPRGQNSLGWAYYTGKFIPQDMEKAFEWTMKAVQNGNPYGMETLFRMYRDGSGVKQDLNEAIVWLKRASDITQEQCSPCAVSEMGECYEYGLCGVEKDEEKAFMYYSHPAAQRKCPGKYNLGRCYLRGIGTPPNIPKGISCLIAASQQEDIDDHIYQECAMRLLAEIYRTGEAGTVDEALADEWLQKAEALKAKTAETADGKSSR